MPKATDPPVDRKDMWDERVHEAAVEYVNTRNYGGSADALARSMIFTAAANTFSVLDADEVMAAIVAGRAQGSFMTAAGL